MYTPGKWEVTKWASHEDIHVSVNEGHSMRFIANCGNPAADTLPTNPDAEANAHLISSAPDLCEALRVTLKNLDDGLANKNLALKTMIRQALAKAEGRLD